MELSITENNIQQQSNINITNQKDTFENINNDVITYDSILQNMGMVVINGKLEFYNKQKLQNQQNQQTQHTIKPIIKQTIKPNKGGEREAQFNNNTYIYNKYFKNNPYIIQQQHNNNNKQPKNIQEYKHFLIQNIINNINSKKQKSTKLLLINDNNKIYSFKHNNVDKLFSFSYKK